MPSLKKENRNSPILGTLHFCCLLKSIVIHGCLGYEHYLVSVSYKSQLNHSNRTISSKTKLHVDGSNFFDNNVNTVSLARTYWGIPSES